MNYSLILYFFGSLGKSAIDVKLEEINKNG